MQFTEWLLEQEDRTDTVGSLAYDVREDRDWPRPTTIDEARDYLMEVRASWEAREALEDAWQEWRGVRARMKKPAVARARMKRPARRAAR